MNINELFEEIQDEFLPEEINGEYLLQEKCIVWSHSLNEDISDIDNFDDNDEEIGFNFEASSSEELLLEAYQEDLEKLNDLFDELDETDKWNLSDTNTTENIISFNIY